MIGEVKEKKLLLTKHLLSAKVGYHCLRLPQGCIQAKTPPLFFLTNLYWSIVIYNVVLVSTVYTTVNQLYIYLLFFRFFSHIGHYRVLNRAPCAV